MSFEAHSMIAGDSQSSVPASRAQYANCQRMSSPFTGHLAGPAKPAEAISETKREKIMILEYGKTCLKSIQMVFRVRLGFLQLFPDSTFQIPQNLGVFFIRDYRIFDGVGFIVGVD